ncbi:Cytochrome b-c1 complex subunit 7 [Triticum urartu]|uniref:Complex III subunit VII n=1 Tax=Triticum urartu TaxID=4572 RepID=M7ZI83_TRIUA|nr:Cytochrome b-c1 complex subunit 7 [Triticum urartu]
MLSAFSSWFVNPRRNPLARIHMLTISNRLKNYGLRYDDLYDPYFDLDIKEALCRLPREVVDARHQRLKRAMDLSMKHQYLPDDVRALQTPFKSYLSDMLALAPYIGGLPGHEAEQRVRAEDKAQPPYQIADTSSSCRHHHGSGSLASLLVLD